MRRLRLRLSALYQKFPGVGYALAAFVCGALVLAAVLHWEWGFFVLWPGLNGLCHVLAPKRVWGGRAYWTLAGLWFGAALLGVLAHWTALDPYTPWFSLARYALFAAAYLAQPIAWLIARPEFSAREEPKLKRPLAKGMAVLALLLQALQVCVVVYLTPFHLALAPHYPGLQAEQIWTAPQVVPEGEGAYRMAWSPDSRYLVAKVGDEIWALDPDQRKATLVAPDAYTSSQPWLASGEGLLLKRPAKDGGGVCFVARDDWRPQLVEPSPHIGVPSCSPIRNELVLTVSSGDSGDPPDIWVISADWSERRLLAEEGAWPEWSPDGEHVVFFRRSDETGQTETWVSDLDGSARRLPIDMSRPPIFGLDWVSADSFALITSEGPRVEEGGLMPRLLRGSRGHAVLSLWDLTGTQRARHEARVSLDLGVSCLAARPGRDQVAFSAGLMSLVPSGSGGLLAVDLASGELWRVPIDIWAAFDLAWSPDGETLAVSGMSLGWDPVMGAREAAGPEWGVWLVTGW